MVRQRRRTQSVVPSVPALSGRVTSDVRQKGVSPSGRRAVGGSSKGVKM